MTIDEALEMAKTETALHRAKRYTPKMVVALRAALIAAKAASYTMADIGPTRATLINAEMQLEAWENNEFSKL